ncbi:hypothetical protein MHYP_G00339830 [Metynnis hypsauchen]
MSAASLAVSSAPSPELMSVEAAEQISKCKSLAVPAQTVYGVCPPLLLQEGCDTDGKDRCSARLGTTSDPPSWIIQINSTGRRPFRLEANRKGKSGKAAGGVSRFPKPPFHSLRASRRPPQD